MIRSQHPAPNCTCIRAGVDELCPVHGVFAKRWSGEFSLGELPAPALELERRERARRRRLKVLR